MTRKRDKHFVDSSRSTNIPDYYTKIKNYLYLSIPYLPDEEKTPLVLEDDSVVANERGLSIRPKVKFVIL